MPSLPWVTRTGTQASSSAKCVTTRGSTAPVDARLVFDLPFEERWAGAWRLLGIQPERMSPVAGHA